MELDKCEKISISLPSQFLEAIEGEQFRRKLPSRSAWIQEAVEHRLRDSGALPGNPKAELLATIEEIGVEPALEILRREHRARFALSGAEGSPALNGRPSPLPA